MDTTDMQPSLVPLLVARGSPVALQLRVGGATAAAPDRQTLRGPGQAAQASEHEGG